MEKIFTLEFLYQNINQYAQVNINMRQKEPWFHIQFHNTELDKIILTNHLRYAGIEGYKNLDAYHNENGKELLDCLCHELEKHIK